MKKMLFTLLLGCSFFALATSVAFADNSRFINVSAMPPPINNTQPQQLTMTQAIQKVEEAGYTNITKAEFDSGRYEIKALNKDGQRIELHVDPKTGNIIQAQKDDD